MSRFFRDCRHNDRRFVCAMIDGIETWVRLPLKMAQINHIVVRQTAFGSMDEMRHAKGDYRPSIECSNRSRYLMAESYDLLQKLHGDDRRAYRYVNDAMLQANIVKCHESALITNENPYGANDGLEVYSNQAMRDATVLAVLGDDILIEYEMPAGSTALLQYTVRGGELSAMKNVNYNTCPKRWINEMRAENMDWIGRGQRMHKPLPFPVA